MIRLPILVLVIFSDLNTKLTTSSLILEGTCVHNILCIRRYAYMAGSIIGKYFNFTSLFLNQIIEIKHQAHTTKKEKFLAQPNVYAL